MEGSPFFHQETGLPNYPLLLDRLNMSLAFSRRYLLSIAICYLRLNLPKGMSEYSSDEVMETTINRMKNSIRDIDTIAKVGTNDFILLLVDINESECQEQIKHLITTLNTPLKVNYNEIKITVNLGVCLSPFGSEIQEELITVAKTQLLEAIAAGENTYRMYNGKLDAEAYRKVLIERDLPHSIKLNQLYLNFQPLFYVNDFEIKGVEAVLRWKHPILGVIPPNDFISLAEATGFIHSIFFWSLESICKQIHLLNQNIKVSINISLNEILEPDFKEKLLFYIKKYQVNPAQLTLEITEGQKIKDIDHLSQVISSIKEKGLTIALDDFGNGYFSFIDFVKLPIDMIKLDKQFVMNQWQKDYLDSSIKHIVDMAHQLSYQVVIEGIEHRNQFMKWRDFECDIIQGYYISKPLPFEKLLETITKIPKRLKEDIEKYGY